jgi:dolichol-phosphate mannosyltransferase
MKSGGWSFLEANVAATMAAMTLNFFINNWFTYRDLRLTGGRLFTGLLTFYLACSIGALASFSIANFLFTHGAPWYLAGLTGMAVASVWNYAATRTLAWRARQRVTAYR